MREFKVTANKKEVTFATGFRFWRYKLFFLICFRYEVLKEPEVIAPNPERRFATTLTDAQALKKLTDLYEEGKIKTTGDGSFVETLVKATRLSQKQIAWVHKIVYDHSPSLRKATNPGIEKLKRMIGNRKLSEKNEEFALDLICASRKRPLTEKQRMWVDNLAANHKEASDSPLPSSLVNPLTKRVVQVNLKRARDLASKLKQSDLPADWKKVIAAYRKSGEAFA